MEVSREVWICIPFSVRLFTFVKRAADLNVEGMT